MSDPVADVVPKSGSDSVSRPVIVRLCFHDRCFDGAASAAVFSRFYRECINPRSEFRYTGMTHRAVQPFENGMFDGDENVIVDFKYSSSPKVTWWFDHHQSAFLSNQDEKHFRADSSGKKFHDPAYRSCTKFIAEMTHRHFGFDANQLDELIHWADIIDGAQFADAQAAVELREPAMKLMLVIEGIRDPKSSRRLIESFRGSTLAGIMALDWVQAAFQPLYKHHLASVNIIRESSHYSNGTVFFDISGYDDMEGYNKFVPYYLYPEAIYSVGVSRSSFRSKISVGSNPWSLRPRTHNLAAICERHGGGGHPVVGAISFAPEDLSRARLIAQEIARELRGES